MAATDYRCSHSDVYEGVRINCNAGPGEPCLFVDKFGHRKSKRLIDVHSEREEEFRAVSIREGEEPSVEEFMKALESNDRI